VTSLLAVGRPQQQQQQQFNSAFSGIVLSVGCLSHRTILNWLPRLSNDHANTHVLAAELSGTRAFSCGLCLPHLFHGLFL